MYRFKVLTGVHIQNDADGREKVFRANSENNIVESHVDLAHKFNATGLSPKFERLFDSEVSVHDKAKIAALEAEVAALKATQTNAATSPNAPSQPITPVPKPESLTLNLDAMTLDELKALAAEEEIDLKNAKKREDVLHIIKSHRR